MKPATAFLLLAAAVCLAGCPKGSVPTGWSGSTLPAPDAATLSLLRASGDQATLVFLLRPDRWPAARKTLRQLLPSLPLPPDHVEKVLGAPDVLAALVELVELAEEKPLGWPRTWPGWDPSRPIVAALFEPRPYPLARAARILLPGPTRAGVPGMRHRVLVPATDVKSLLQAMIGFLASEEIRPEERAAAFPGLKGGVLYAFPDHEGFVAFIPESGHVRIELLTHERRPAQGPGRDGVSREVPGAATFDTTFSAWRELLDHEPGVTSLPRTPALHHATTSRDFLVAYLRPWQLRDVFSQVGARMVLDATCAADPSMRAVLMAQGLAEVSTGSLLMTPVGAEVDDIAAGLSFGEGVRIREVASLTRLGAEVFRAGTTGATGSFSAGEVPALLKVSLRLDTGAMLDRAERPPHGQQAENLEEWLWSLRECGIGCIYHALLRNPVGTLKALRAFARFDAVQHLPRSLELVVVDVNPRNPAAPVRAALAASMPPGYDATWLRKALAEIEQPRHSGGALKTQVAVEPGKDHDTLLLGFNYDPHRVFQRLEPRPAEASASFRLDWSILAEFLAGVNPGASPLLARLRVLQGLGYVRGRALAGEIILTRHEEKQVGHHEFPDYSGMDWPSPGLAEARSKGAGCLAALTRGMITAFKALAGVDPSQKSLLLARAIEESRPELDCALLDPHTREEAAGIDEVMTLFLDSVLGQAFRREERLRVLSGACRRGIPEACRLEKEVRSQPAVELASIGEGCGASPFFGSGLEVVRVSAGRSNQARDLPGGSIALAVDRAATFGQVEPLLRRLVDRGDGWVDFVFRNSAGGTSNLRVGLPGQWNEPLREVRGGTVFVLAMGKDRIHVAGPGGRIDVPAFESCPEEGSCLNQEKLFTTLDQVHEAFPDIAYGLDVDGDTPWKAAAGALEILACGKALDQGRSWRREVILGRAPVSSPDPPRASTARPGESPKITPGRAVVSGSLSKEEIQRVIRRNLARVKHCYEKELVKHPEIEGRIGIRFTVGPAGKVIQAKVGDSTFERSAVGSCLLEVIRRMRFPKPRGGGVVQISYPFHFKVAR